jgi:hypothetical protein
MTEDPRNKLKSALLNMKISFNGKRESIPPGISLIDSVKPGNYYIQYAKLSKVTPTQLEIDSTGRLITTNIHIVIDAFDIVTSIYAKNKY